MVNGAPPSPPHYLNNLNIKHLVIELIQDFKKRKKNAENFAVFCNVDARRDIKIICYLIFFIVQTVMRLLQENVIFMETKKK